MNLEIFGTKEAGFVTGAGVKSVLWLVHTSGTKANVQHKQKEHTHTLHCFKKGLIITLAEAAAVPRDGKLPAFSYIKILSKSVPLSLRFHVCQSCEPTFRAESFKSRAIMALVSNQLLGFALKAMVDKTVYSEREAAYFTPWDLIGKFVSIRRRQTKKLSETIRQGVSTLPPLCWE